MVNTMVDSLRFYHYNDSDKITEFFFSEEDAIAEARNRGRHGYLKIPTVYVSNMDLGSFHFNFFETESGNASKLDEIRRLLTHSQDFFSDRLETSRRNRILWTPVNASKQDLIADCATYSLVFTFTDYRKSVQSAWLHAEFKVNEDHVVSTVVPFGSVTQEKSFVLTVTMVGALFRLLHRARTHEWFHNGSLEYQPFQRCAKWVLEMVKRADEMLGYQLDYLLPKLNSLLKTCRGDAIVGRGFTPYLTGLTFPNFVNAVNAGAVTGSTASVSQVGDMPRCSDYGIRFTANQLPLLDLPEREGGWQSVVRFDSNEPQNLIVPP